MSSTKPHFQRWKTSPPFLPPFPRSSIRDSGISVGSCSPSYDPPLSPHLFGPRSKSVNDLNPDISITFPVPFDLKRDVGSAFNAWTPLWKSVHKSAALTFQLDAIPGLRCFNEAARKFNWLVVRLRGDLGLTDFTYEYDVWSKDDIKKFPIADGVPAMLILQSATGLLDEVGSKLGNMCRAKKRMLRTRTLGSWYVFREQQGVLGEKLPGWAYAMEGHDRELRGILARNGIVMEERPKELNVMGGLMGRTGLIPIRTPTWVHNLSLWVTLKTEKVALDLGLNEARMSTSLLYKMRYQIQKAWFSRPGREQGHDKAAKAFKKLYAKLGASKSTSTGTLLLTKKVKTRIWQYENMPILQEEDKEDGDGEESSEETDGPSDTDDEEIVDCLSDTAELVDYKGPVVRAMTEPVARQLDAAGAAAQACRFQQYSRLPPIHEHQAFEKFADVQILELGRSQQTPEDCHVILGEQQIVDCGTLSCYSRSEYSLERTDTGVPSPGVSSSSFHPLFTNRYADQTTSQAVGQPNTRDDCDSVKDSATFIPARTRWRLHR